VIVGGNVVDQYSYDLWGEPEAVSETVPQQLRYAGYWYDTELGWYWLSVRSYDPEGRLLQPDPSEQDGVRTYVYVNDDPADATDSSGLSPDYQPLRNPKQWLACPTAIKSKQCPTAKSDPINVVISGSGTLLMIQIKGQIGECDA